MRNIVVLDGAETFDNQEEACQDAYEVWEMEHDKWVEDQYERFMESNSRAQWEHEQDQARAGLSR